MGRRGGDEKRGVHPHVLCNVGSVIPVAKWRTRAREGEERR